MTTIIWPTNTTEVIDNIRGAIGRNINWITITTSPCPTCGLEYVTGDALDPFCPTCSGYGVLKTKVITTISGHITWAGADQVNWQTAGQLFEGDCRAQIKYTPENVTIVEDAEWVEIDNKKMEIDKVTYRGVPQINRILVDLIEVSREV